MCHGMEFGWIRSRCWLGKRVGCLERGWTVSGMELWVGEPERREQVREITLGLGSNTKVRLPDSKICS